MQIATTGTASRLIAGDATDRLIASDKVEGTAVYNRRGERLGSVYNFMVDKRTGQVLYAVVRRPSRPGRQQLPAALEGAELRH